MLRVVQINRRGISPWGQIFRDAEHNVILRSRYSSLTNYHMSQVTLQNAKVNSEVKLTSHKWGDAANNPVWDGNYGQVKGKLTKVMSNCVEVEWSNGTKNYYDDSSLETIDAVPTLVITPTSSAPVVAKATAITLSLEDAVRSVIAAKIAAGESFSGYDITSAIRREVNESRVSIENRSVEDVNGRQTQRITHDEVRPFVRSYMDTISSYDRRFNGDYILFQPNGTPVVPSVSATAASAPGAKTLMFTPTGVASSAGSSVASTIVDTTRLVTYITNRGSRTLKQIQSRFKVEGGSQPTVRDIAKTAQAAGLRIDTKPVFHQSVVTR